MTTLREAAQQALEALQWHYRQGHSNTLGGFRLKIDEKALRELSAALAQQDEPVEPVAWIQPDHLQKARIAPFLCRVEPTQRCADFVPLYLAPPQRKPLTEEEIDAEWRELDGEVSTMFMRVLRKFARAIERAHGIGVQS